MIRSNKGKDDSNMVAWLMNKLNITDLQAYYIINVNIKKLSPYYLSKYKDEANAYIMQRDTIRAKNIDDDLIKREIFEELVDIKAKYARPRACRIVNKANTADIPAGTMTVIITEKNFIKKAPAGNPFGTLRGDNIKSVITLDNTDNLIIFDSAGKVYKLSVSKIPFTDKNTNGIDIRFMVKTLTANICSVIPEGYIKRFVDGDRNNIKAKHFLITVTKAGLIKRMDLEDFIVVPPSGLVYAKVDPDDTMTDIIIAHSSFDIIVYSDKKAARMNVLDIPYLKRNTKGSRAMLSNQPIDGMTVIDKRGTALAVVTEAGYINRLDLSVVPNNGKGKGGFKVIDLAKTDRISSIFVVGDNHVLTVKTANRETLVIPVLDIPASSSISKGTKCAMVRGDKVLHSYITMK